jgi:hypothetical protein
MEKISGSVPSNARTKSVDVSRSQPVRPGAPAWGRPEGKVTKAVEAIEDKVTLSSVAAERPLETTYPRGLTESRKLQIAKETTDKFFENNFPQKEVKESGMALSEEMSESIDSVPLRSSVKPLSSNDDIE